jgi:hypothetical protein
VNIEASERVLFAGVIEKVEKGSMKLYLYKISDFMAKGMKFRGGVGCWCNLPSEMLWPRLEQPMKYTTPSVDPFTLP